MNEPTIVHCYKCHAEIYWARVADAQHPRRKIPLDAPADNRPPPRGGELFAYVNAESRELWAEAVDFSKPWDRKRNRYTNHLDLCPMQERDE